MMDDETHSWKVLSLHGAPDPELLRDLLDLAAAAAESDGNPPFSEQTLLELRSPGPAAVTVYAVYGNDDDGSAPADLAGAAVVIRPGNDGDPDGPGSPASAASPGTPANAASPDSPANTASPDSPASAAGTDSPDDSEASGAVAELVVRPAYRNQGVGGSVVARIAADGDLSDLSAWSHGNHAAAAQLATAVGFTAVRELWRMRRTRSVHEDAAQADGIKLPDGIKLRSFKRGQDEQAWLDANAAAFAHHPEQGRTTLADLQARMAEEWFDPAGFLLAVRVNPGAEDDGELLGFHWTKVHPAAGDHPAIGEVYVVGVTPKAQGLGLGKALTLAGIEHLHSAGLQALMLYVDADNAAAVALYRKLGFTRWDVDVMYAADPQRSGL